MAETVTAPDFQKKLSYHHGNLRDALLGAAADILEQEGIDALSLRALARKTGVTQAAPYSHFRDKDELLAAVAERGFQRLALSMVEAAGGLKDARERVEKLVTAYIAFAQENRALFHVMFSRALSDPKKYPTLAMTAGKSYALFAAVLAKAAEGEEARFLTVALYSLCHGLTGLLIEDKLKPETFGAESIEAFIRRTLDVVAPQLRQPAS